MPCPGGMDLAVLKMLSVKLPLNEASVIVERRPSLSACADASTQRADRPPVCVPGST